MNNVGRNFSNYVRTGMLSLLMCASSCTQKEAPNIARKVSNPVEQKADSVGKLLSMLERGDFHSIYISKKTKKDIISVNEISKYVPNDSVGELFYQVYVGNADKAIRKANNKKGKCLSEEKVKEYDREVLKRCNLSEGKTISYDEFKNLVYKNVLIPEKREEICGNCQWNELCYFKN